VLVLLLVVGLSAPALARKKNSFKAELDGFQETPAISTTGTGEFRARISKDEDSIDFELTYSGLEGGAVTAAHIHLGQAGVAGGVSAFLCGGGGKPACPASGTVEATIVASDVIGPAGQGIAAGELDELVAAIRDGVTYANVHTTTFPTGEIRGRIK
jgi:hypothetical protein